MLIDKETLRLIFGLKLRSLRDEKKLSLKDLAKKTGLSPSYINEIEKGKKYPKTEKILTLAHALDEKYENLISLELKKELQLIQKLMDKKVFKTLPFDFFGIPTSTLFELIAESPEKMSALVGTVLEIARAHNIQIDDIFHALLRSYIDMNGNYFPELEKLAEETREKFKINLKQTPEKIRKDLIRLLAAEFKTEVIEAPLGKLSYYVKNKGRTVHLSNSISVPDQIFILAREIGYHVQQVENRPVSSLIVQLDSFEQLKNHFSASYFAGSLMVPYDKIVKDCELLFKEKKWNLAKLQDILARYAVPTESIFHRLTQILPRHFGMNHLFFLRYEYDPKLERYEISRELHLSSLHSPHRIKGNEHYCSRWLVNKLTQSVISTNEKVKIGIQRSHFVDNENEYLIIAASFKSTAVVPKTTSVCLGLLVNENLQQKLQFLNSESIPRIQVGETCERCSVGNCKERKAPRDLPLEELFSGL